ncbi:alkaline phosphatase family protein [Natronorubrum texcoconense]|uniref:Sulfatase n=1 Tax=Natronorubrum texcoconense TaxID=1095776 RepID=A0A1G8U3L4_9EURY|nr:hypothetical protein [Natronorubrum texcoconense]SDJ48368.1 hypothetical protein SAMN04515672_0722 [Natronorubrum texcoconense]
MNSGYYRDIFTKAAKDPIAAVNFAKRVLKNGYYDRKYERYRRREGISLQYDTVHELVNNEEFVLVILDSCRYDYFRDEYPAYLSGDLSQVWSAGNRTPKWTPNLWTESYDLTYLSTMSYPTTKAAYRKKRITFDPYETFENVIRIDGHDDPLLSNTPPEIVTDIALQYFASVDPDPIRAVLHYSLPHRPYVGATKILPWRVDVASALSVFEEHRSDDDVPSEELSNRETVFGEELLEYDVTEAEFEEMDAERYEVRQRIDDGHLSDDELRVAYRDNLRAVLAEVTRLVGYLDCPVVISADHGEHLGEHSDELPRYNHPNRTHPVLREVPWFEVGPESKGNEALSSLEKLPELVPDENREPTAEAVDKRLRALGYR